MTDHNSTEPVRRPLPLPGRRARQRRMVVITLAAAALLLVSYLTIRARHDDMSAADDAASRVEAVLAPQLDQVDLAEAYGAISAAKESGGPPPAFPTRPEVPGATLEEARAAPDQVVLVYRVSVGGIDRCVTGARSEAAGTSVSVDACRGR